MSGRSGSVMCRRVAGLLGIALDALLPARCLACGGLVDDPGALCSGCWDGIAFLGPPHCVCCGHPFEVDPGEASLCGACIGRLPPWRRSRAVLRYDDAAKGLILRFKHADRTDAAPAFARLDGAGRRRVAGRGRADRAGAAYIAGGFCGAATTSPPCWPWRLAGRRR